MEKQIILLNGPSSSGKSSLSKALQDLIEERQKGTYPIISIDDFMKLATDETIYEDDVYEISGDMCTAALDALEAFPGVIIDHVITSPRIFQQLITMLGQYPIHTVHVTCPLQVLIDREIARKNRCVGSAETSFTYLYPKEGYDLTVDTSVMRTEDCAMKIFDFYY